MNTQFAARRHLYETYSHEELQRRASLALASFVGSSASALHDDVMAACAEDVLAVANYRDTCPDWNVANFSTWLAERGDDRLRQLCAQDVAAVHDFLRPERDFMYTAAGVNLLRTRYLYGGEHIQYGMLRVASTLATPHAIETLRSEDYYTDMLRCFYDMLSCCMLSVSSIVAYANRCKRAYTNPGEACRLMVCNSEYDADLVVQMERLKTIISLGVGVGLGASTVPLHGIQEIGKVHSGFHNFVRNIEACNYLSIHTRKPKVAIYLHIDCDTVFEAFDMKHPSRDRMENVFFGLLISDLFMRCVKRNEPWYLFSGQLRHEKSGRSLRDFDHDPRAYEVLRADFVRRGLYTTKLPARELMRRLIRSLCVSGNPYVVWIDRVNEFNNQAHLGPIRTLNLCAEITNYADDTNWASCTLMSANMAVFHANASVQQNCWRLLSKHYNAGLRSELRLERTEHEYAALLGYASTVALNNLLKDAERREIGVNPYGMFDAALLMSNARTTDINPVDTCARMCEALYKGCVMASCDYRLRHDIVCVNYPNSKFSAGEPQWKLRSIEPSTDWTNLRKRMTDGMANSMLVAQAPTATTSLLIGACESITVPLDVVYTRESGNGRNRIIPYGIATAVLTNSSGFGFDCGEFNCTVVRNDIDTQIEMYKVSAPYVDHSQSTMFSVRIDDEAAVFDLIVKTFKAQLKTGIYYVVPKNTLETLTIVRKFAVANDRSTANACDACTL